MDGGDLATQQRFATGGDLSTVQRQSGSGFISWLGNLIGLGPGELQKHMSQPAKRELSMQRGGFPWALAGLSLLPMLLGKGKDGGGGGGGNIIERQMKSMRDPIMQRGGLSIPPGLLAKGLPLLKSMGIPLAMGALASVGDNVVDKVFGDGKAKQKKARTHHTMRKGNRKTSRNSSRVSGRRAHPTVRGATRGKRTTTTRSRKKKSTANLVGEQLQSTGRRLFQKIKSKAKSRVKSNIHARLSRKSSPRRRSTTTTNTHSSPFALKIRENLNRASSGSNSSSTSNSAHIAPTFNI